MCIFYALRAILAIDKAELDSMKFDEKKSGNDMSMFKYC
jgi:hypothetical protein